MKPMIVIVGAKPYPRLIRISRSVVWIATAVAFATFSFDWYAGRPTSLGAAIWVLSWLYMFEASLRSERSWRSMVAGYSQMFEHLHFITPSAIDCLRDIAAMGNKAGSETAKNWLLQHGIPADDDEGYVPGKGFAK